MSKFTKNENGFSGIEILMVVVIVALIGAVGYMVYKNKHQPTKVVTVTKTATKTPTPVANVPTVANPYSGWKEYTLKYEKLSFQYPSIWTIQDSSGSQGLSPNTDSVTLTAADGFNVSIDDGWDGSGDNLQIDTNNTVPIKFIGGSDYLVFLHPKIVGGPANPNQNSLVSAILMTNPSNQYDKGSIANYFPQDKNAQGNPNINNGGSTMLISANYSGPKYFENVSQAENDIEYKNFILMLQSAHY